MESPPLHSSLDESNTASTVSSPPDPNTPPQQLYQVRDYAEDVEERKVFSRVQSPAYQHQSHHQELTILPPIHSSRIKSEPSQHPLPSPPADHQSYSASYLDVPAFTYDPPQLDDLHSTSPLGDRIPPLERASVDGGFWPTPNSTMPAPSTAVRRSSFLAELYGPQDASIEASQLEPSPSHRDNALPPILANYHSNPTQWSAQSPLPSTDHLVSSHSQQPQLPPISYSHHSPATTPVSAPSAPNYYTPSPSAHEQPPFYRRASYPIARDDNLPVAATLSSDYIEQQNYPPPSHPNQPVTYNGTRQGPLYTEPVPLSAPSLSNTGTNYGTAGGYHYTSRQDSAPSSLQYQHHQSYQQSQAHYPHSYGQQQQQQPPCLPRSSHSLPPSASWGYVGQPIMHTDDAASKETAHLRRRCFNCHTTEPPSWRRSTLNPGKIVCNRCGLYERTHLRPRPSGIGGELRKAPPKLNHTQSLIGNTAPYTLAPMVSKAGRAKTLNVTMQAVQEYGTAH